MLSEFSPEEFAARMEQAGFVEADHVSPEEQVRRYLQGRRDIPDPPPNFAFALFRRKERKSGALHPRDPVYEGAG